MKGLLLIASSLTLCFISSKHQKQQQKNPEDTPQQETKSKIITRNDFDITPPARTESPPAYAT
jgi:hypothetical protein